jgi:ABC-type lipoprotein release transport system permease subunit
MAGVVVSIALARAIESMLYGPSPVDRATYAVVIGVMAVSALGACVLPARRAGAVDPAATLKAE